jgi:tripartite-type tricarboxylate transporter receptor subunit TctC
MMKFPRRSFLQVSAGAALSLPRVAMAEDAYPSRPIHVVIGFTPGAAADVAARILAAGAAPILGQQLVVENKPGAGSSIAADYVAHAAKDGYTVFLATLSIITNQITNRNESIDLIRDFTPVALLESGAVILVVNPDSHLRNVAELVALAKSKPGDVLHATVLTQVPYPGSPQTVIDVIAGRALMTFAPASSVVGQIAAGKLTPLATAANKRSRALPNVPTMAEAGIPDFDTSLWFGLLAPAGTPRPIVEKLAAAAHKAMRAPDAVETLRKQGYEPLDAGPDEFASFMRSEIARWSEVARSAGLGT